MNESCPTCHGNGFYFLGVDQITCTHERLKTDFMGAIENHVYHHTEGPKVNVKAEKNSKGWNYEATVTGAADVDQAMTILNTAIQALHVRFDPPDPEPEPVTEEKPLTEEEKDPICPTTGLRESVCECEVHKFPF